MRTQQIIRVTKKYQSEIYIRGCPYTVSYVVDAHSPDEAKHQAKCIAHRNHKLNWFHDFKNIVIREVQS